MTTPSTERKAGPLLGTGSQTTWPFTFKVFAATDIAVTIANSLGVETQLTFGVDYTVTLNANQETSPGGTVTYPISGSPLPVGSRLVIVGNLPYDQPLDLPSGGNFSPLALENQLDRLTMQTQQLRERLGRALQVSVTTNANATLPAPTANQLIGWDAGGSNLQNVPLADIATALAFATYRYDTFTGDGVETQFTLSADPAVIGNLDVAIGGVTQTPNTDYTLSSGVLVFSSAPPLGATILARYGEGLSPGAVAGANDVAYTPAGVAAVTRTAESKLRETVSVKDFGAVGDGVTDDTAAVADAAQTSYAIVPAGTYKVAFDVSSGYVTKGLIGVDPSADLNNPNLDEATVTIASTNYQRPNRAKVYDLAITGANTDLTNNYPDLSTWSSFSHYIGNYIHDVSCGIAVSYLGVDSPGATAAFGGTLTQFTANTPVAQPLRASSGVTVAFNNIVNANIIGQQIFCTDHTRVIGNAVVNNTPSTQHGYRFTGYPGGPTNFNAAAANTAKNVQNGLSVQTATRYNSLSGFVTESPTNAGLSLNVNSTLADWHHSYNYLQGVSQGGVYGVYAAKPQYNHIQHIVDGATTWGVQFDNSGTYGLNKGNMLDAVIANCGEGANINSSSNHVRVVLSQLGGRGITVAGSYNIIDVVCDTPSASVNTFALQISGSNNVVRIASVGNANTADISISGNQNLIECMCAKSIVVSGNNNKFIGLINTVGTTNISNSGTGNDFNGLKGVSGVYVGTATTNASGQVTISSTYDRPQGGGGLTYYAIGQLQAAAGVLAGCTVNYVNTTTTNGFNFVVYNAAGAALASTSVTIVVQFGHAIT